MPETSPQPSPPTSPALVPEIDAPSARERIFTLVLRAISVVVLPVVIANILSVLRRGDLSRAGLYLGIYLFLLLLSFGQRRIPFQGRVWGVLLVLWVAAWAAYTIAGIRGDGRVWLLGATVIAALFLEGWQAPLAVLLSLGLHFLFGWLVVQGLVPYPAGEALLTSRAPRTWIATGLALTATGMIIGGIIFFLRRTLEQSLEESHHLTTILEQERQRLETQQQLLQRRLAQLRTASEISRAATTHLDEEALLNQVVNLIRERFGLYYVGIFLLDARGEYAVLRAGTGEAGQKMLAEGHRLAVGGTSMIGWCIANRQPRIALDVGEEAVRFENPHLPLTRSELALPLISRGEVLGAMTIQSERPKAFDQDDLVVLQGIADAIATALDNARLFRTTQEALNELKALHAQFLAEAWSDLPEQGLQVSAAEPEPSPAEEAPAHQLRLPLRVRDFVVGEALLERDTPWEEEDKALAEALLNQASLALENAGLLAESLRRAAQEEILNRMSTRVGATLDLDHMLRTALKELQQTLHLQEAEIRLVTPADASLQEG